MPGRRTVPCRIRKAACIENERHFDVDDHISDGVNIGPFRVSHPVHAGIGEGSRKAVDDVDVKNADFRSRYNFGSRFIFICG